MKLKLGTIRLFFIFAFFSSCLVSYGQTGIWKPFKLLVVQPDTAIVDQSFNSQKDSVEAQNLRAYYATLKQLKDMLDTKDDAKDMEKLFAETHERLKKQIPLIEAQEEQVKKFKYYQTISQYSAQVYNFYFNEYEPFSTILEIPKHNTDLGVLKILADTSKADYIVFFSNIYSNTKDGLPILKLTTSLYSNKANKIILTKETEGDIDSRGFMWTCEIPLSCLLVNSVRTSTDEVMKILKDLQVRKAP